jgi:protein-S-isoprenylcysteine O-methyltransferase Ste14
MSLTGRWTDLIYKVATGDWRTRAIVAPIAGACFIGFIAVFVILSRSVDLWLGLPKAFSYPMSPIIGSSLIILGLFLIALSIACFLRVRGTPVPFSPPPTLVATGPYRFSRNPMLTGIFILLFGIAVVLGSLSLMFIFTPLFIVINIWELKKVEEPELARRLGDAYLAYRKQVPMFSPLLRKLPRRIIKEETHESGHGKRDKV